MALCSLCAVLVLAAFIRPIAPLCALVLPFVMLGAFGSGIATPFVSGRRIATTLEPPGRRRRRLLARIVAIGLALNLVIGAAYWCLGVFLVHRVVGVYRSDLDAMMDD